jgi:CheY-like chemotaxis protein
VLLVDDMPINQLVARKFLERAGIIVTTAENGLEALDAATGGAAFDAILMDLQMPEMDGFEAARNLCARLGDGCPPILAMTAHSPVEEAARCREAGMVGCLGKPIDVERLLLELARVMDIPGL